VTFAYPELTFNRLRNRLGTGGWAFLMHVAMLLICELFVSDSDFHQYVLSVTLDTSHHRSTKRRIA
jgi:hypothetical protein